MANNTGLQFNPFTGLGNWGDNSNQSVPTVVDDYMQPIQPLNIKWNPNQLKKAKDFINWEINTSAEDMQRQLNPVFQLEEDLQKWNIGLAGLANDERALWESQNYAKLLDKNEQQRDRLWRNQQFISVFGRDTFDAMKGRKEERDEMYKDALADRAIQQRFAGNENIDQLRSLTFDSKMDLLKSDYKSDAELRAINNQSKDKDWGDYSLGERWDAISSQAVSQGLAGMSVGSVVGAGAGTPLFGVGAVLGGIAGAGIGGAAGFVSGVATGLFHPEDSQGISPVRRRMENDEILNNIQVADNEKKKTDSEGEINHTFANYVDAYQKGQITSQEADEMFDNIALNGKRTATDELGNTEEYDYTGSNYYSAFKDSDEFEHFSVYDKLKYIAQTETLARKYGRGAAMQILEQDMQNYVSDNQSGWTWAGNTAKNIWVGGVANLGMNVTALGALGARLAYGEEGLANYLKGMDASGDGTENSWINNMKYWHKVDELNTFDTNKMEEAERNGGVSQYNNVYKPGEEGDFWSWQTLNEAVKMNKFAWSDLIKNISLGKLVQGATRLFGGSYIAPGVLSTESPALAKATNTLGSAGVMAAGSLGIDAAYGMQTYNEVLNENNSKLDKIIEKDTQDEVQRRLQTSEAQAEFRAFVDAENERRRRRAGERGSYIAVDEQEAWKDYIAHTEKVVREEQEKLHAEDRQQAENDAANAYVWDATIEGLRMASTNGMFKSYLFDKGTLNALRLNNPYVNTTFKNGAYALGKNATRKKALGVLGTNVWGGFHSNYYDDVTVGFAKGFGIQDYNNYLLEKYNPAAYGSVIDEYVNPFLAAMQEVGNAATDKRSFLDGGIGALGTFFTVSPNVGGMIGHKARMQQLSKSIENAEKNGVKTDGIHWSEMMGDYINSPIIQAIAEAKAATRMTQSEINRANKAIKDNGWSLDNIVEAAEALNGKAIARQGTSVMEAEDAKDREAFTLASTLLSLKNSGVVANAQVEPDRAGWTAKKKASKMLSSALNAMMGISVFEAAETPYTRAMQALEDAATIDELPAYLDGVDASEIVGNPNAEKAMRQSSLIKTFLNLDQNKNAIKDMSEEEQIAFAQERLKKNATGLIDMMQRTEELQKRFENSVGAQYHPEVAQQLIYQYALNDRWQQRYGELEEQITGENPVSNDKNWFNKRQQRSGQENTVMAKYGSVAGWERARKAQEKRVKAAQETYEKAQQDAKKEDNPNMTIFENMMLKSMRYQAEKNAKENLEKEQASLNTIDSEEAPLKSTIEGTVPIVLAEDILRLNPNDRLRMLDDYYRNDYSVEQQKEIDRAKNILMQDGTTLNETMERVRDAAILSNRIEDNMEAAKKIMNNPYGAQMMQQALEANRRKAVVDYFNDKIVAEAFQDLTRDTSVLLSDEKVADKARGYSTAILNGMLKEVNKQLKGGREIGDILSDADLTNIKDGLETVLDERIEKQKDTLELDSYLRKTYKVKHTETVSFPMLDEATGTLVPITSEVTEDRELSYNDRKLLEYALDYAAEKGMDIDDLASEVAIERGGSNDFSSYVTERNHTDRTVEERANPVDPAYMSTLVDDIVKAYKAHKEETAKATAPKPTADAPKSVATPEVAPTGEKKGNNKDGEEVRPDEKPATNDPFGAFANKGKAAGEGDKGTIPEEDTSGTAANSRNQEIMESIPEFNIGIAGDVEALLGKVDGLATTDEVKNNLKDIISTLVTTRAYNAVKKLQTDMVAETITMDTETAAMATKLAGTTIEGKKGGSGNNNGNNRGNNSETTNAFPPQLNTLESRDLDSMMKYPAWKEFIERYNMVPFLQKLSDLWRKNRKSYEDVHKVQAYFIYDPTIAAKVQKEMEDAGLAYHVEDNAPVIMAIEVSDKTPEFKKAAEELGHELIAIRDVSDNKTIRYYQPVGIMPANQVSTAESESMRFTASQMPAIRSKIEASGKDYKRSGGPYLIRYMRNSNKNDTPIHANITNVTSNTEVGARPENTAETPKKGVQQLMEENSQQDTERLVKIDDAKRQEYEQAKQAGNKNRLRGTELYQTMRDFFVEMLTEVDRKSDDPDAPKRSDLIYHTTKGTADRYPRNVFTRPIGENTPEGREGMTLDRNSNRTIVDLLRGIDAEGETAEETINKAKELIASNSRFWRLHNDLKKLPQPTGLFNDQGVQVNGYESLLVDYAKSVQRIIDNNFNVDKLSVKVDITEGQNGRELNIRVSSGDEVLSTLTTRYGGEISAPEFASFMKHLILNEEGNTRQGLKDTRYERVKWQVDYGNTKVIHDSNATKDQKEAAMNNLRDLYDDGVLMMQVTKLAYPAKSVKIAINKPMKDALWPESNAAPDSKPSGVIENHPVGDAEGENGMIDSDTGMPIGGQTGQSIWDGLAKDIVDRIKKMISDSKERNVSPDNKNHYSILGQIYSRVTSIKYAMDGMKDRFNPESGWALPSSLLGNSADEFSRDVFNGVFDGMTDAQRKAKYADYANSTAKNYEEVYQALKAFQARLLSNGQVIIKTGTWEGEDYDPGHITAKGTMTVNVRTLQGMVAKEVRVAGTLDVLAIDKDGKLHIYDFKTHHSDEFTKADAEEKGYDRQLSMYAAFLEQEYGLPVASINIIPLHTPYPIPSGKNNDGSQIQGAQKTYRQVTQGSNMNQLEVKDPNASDATYKPFDAANFRVEREFKLDRLTPEEMEVSYDKMTEDERAAIVEAVQDQSQNPAEEGNVKQGDIVSTKPEGTAEANDGEETHSLNTRRRRPVRRQTSDSSNDDAAHAIDDTQSTKHDIEEQQRNCGSKPK